MGVHLQTLLNRLSNLFTKDQDSNLAALLGAVGEQLDAVDPVQTCLAAQFSMQTATGEALDRHGKEWNVYRRFGEPDRDYRARIQSVLPIYTNGPTVQAIKDIVAKFIGHEPEILEYGPQSFTMGVTPMGEFVFSENSPFEFLVHLGDDVDFATFNYDDMTAAVNQAKPARATAIFYPEKTD